MRSRFVIALILVMGLSGYCLTFQFPNQAPLPTNQFCNLSVDAGPDITLCSPGETANLNAVISGDLFSISWEPAGMVNDPSSATTTATVNSTTTFEITTMGKPCS